MDRIFFRRAMVLHTSLSPAALAQSSRHPADNSLTCCLCTLLFAFLLIFSRQLFRQGLFSGLFRAFLRGPISEFFICVYVVKKVLVCVDYLGDFLISFSCLPTD